MCYRPANTVTIVKCLECGAFNKPTNETCQKCGADLNEGLCGCKKEADPRLAVLAKLLPQGLDGAPKAPGAPAAPKAPGAPKPPAN